MKPHAPLVAMLLMLAPLAALEACGPKLDPVTESTGGGTGTGAATTGDATNGSSGTTGSTATGTAGGSGVCGTTSATIGYAAQAKAVISTSCASSNCHGGRAPIMTDFASTKAGISGGGLSQINSGSMPLGSTLSANDKCIITTWASGNYAP